MKQKLAIIFLICLILITCLSGCADAHNMPDCIRIHIRANSNDEIDQSIKFIVKTDIVNVLTPLLADCKTKSDAYNIMQKNLDNMKAVADERLAKEGFSYVSTIRLCKEKFPAREYLGTVYESGVYDALIIELGTGDGDNWWCVAFPPLCFIPTSDSENFYYKSKIMEIIENYKEVNNEKQEG